MFITSVCGTIATPIALPTHISASHCSCAEDIKDGRMTEESPWIPTYVGLGKKLLYDTT